MFRPTTLAALSLLLTLGACKKKDDDTGEPLFIVPIDETGDTADFVPPPKIPTEVRLIAFVAWDAANQVIVPPVLEGQEGYISAFQIRLYEGGQDSDYCSVTIDLEGMTMSQDAKGEGFAWGLDIPAGSYDAAFETCTNDGWDIDDFYEGTRPEDWVAKDWHLRFYSALSPELEDWLTPDSPTADFNIFNYTGGDYWTNTDFPNTSDADANYWYGWPMTLENTVDRDNSELLDSRYDMLDASGNMSQGYFIWDQRVYWNLDGE